MSLDMNCNCLSNVDVKTKNRDNRIYYLFIFICFLFSPIFSILLFVLISLHRNKQYNGLYFFGFLIALYLGLINTTKFLENDGLRYFEAFLEAGKYDLVTYILDYGKEPLYRIYVYVSYYLFAGNWNFFIICTTLIFYLLLFSVIIKVGIYIKASYYNIITGIFITGFFFQQFAISAHLIRQCLAEAFLLFYITELYLYGKKKYWFALVPLFIHSTVLPMLGIVSLPQSGKKMNFKECLIIIALIFVLVIVSHYFLSLLNNVPILNYLSTRINSEKLYEAESRQTELGFSMIGLLLSLVLSYMSLAIMKLEGVKKNIYAYANFCIFLVVALFLLDFTEAYYLFERYFFYLYFLIGLVLMIYNHYTKILNKQICLLLMILLLVYFYYKLGTGTFIYEPIMEALFLPVPFYFF